MQKRVASAMLAVLAVFAYAYIADADEYRYDKNTVLNSFRGIKWDAKINVDSFAKGKLLLFDHLPLYGQFEEDITGEDFNGIALAKARYDISNVDKKGKGVFTAGTLVTQDMDHEIIYQAVRALYGEHSSGDMEHYIMGWRIGKVGNYQLFLNVLYMHDDERALNRCELTYRWGL